MKKTRNLLHFIVLNLTLLLTMLEIVGCASSIPTLPTATSVAFAASPTVAASFTPIPASPTSTVTQTPKPTSTRPPRPTSTPQPTQTPTPTAYPTLDSQGRLNFVLQALKTNKGCELPCWWGITPGKTTWKEMVDTFAKQGIGLYQEGQLDLGLVTKANYRQKTVDVTFQRENDLVQGIDVETEYYYLLAQSKYAEAWHKFTLDQMLTHYGVPTQVVLELSVGSGDWSPGMQATYDLWLEYADQGIALRYPGELIYDNQGWYVCPTSDNKSGITIRLRTPDTQAPIVGLGPDNPFQFGGTLEKLTRTNLQQFYEMFKVNPPQGCLLATDPSPWYDEVALPKPSMILPVPQEEEYLINNLASNDDCELPCWWGIKPGETTSQSVQQMFLDLGKSISRYKDYELGQSYRVSLFGRHSPYPFDYVVRLRWYEGKNGVVSLFGVTGSALNWSPPQHFAQDWQRYSLHEALDRYGVPSKVLVHYWNFGLQYDITLVYEDKGFLIRYSGPIVDEGKEFSEKPIIICPVQNKPTEITIWMSKSHSDALARFGYGRRDLSPSDQPMPSLEEVADMTVQGFYETFLKPNTTTCLTVPRKKGEMAP